MYHKILVPLDGSKLAECVLPHVLTLAKGCEVKDIVLLRVCQPPVILADYPPSIHVPFEENVEKLNTFSLQQCSLYLGDMEKKLKEQGLAVKFESRLGNAAEEIVDFAEKNGVDLIVMASHGRSGPSKWAFGSVAEKVLRMTCVPVMLVRAPGCVPGI